MSLFLTTLFVVESVSQKIYLSPNIHTLRPTPPLPLTLSNGNGSSFNSINFFKFFLQIFPLPGRLISWLFHFHIFHIRMCGLLNFRIFHPIIRAPVQRWRAGRVGLRDMEILAVEWNSWKYMHIYTVQSKLCSIHIHRIFPFMNQIWVNCNGLTNLKISFGQWSM